MKNRNFDLIVIGGGAAGLQVMNYVHETFRNSLKASKTRKEEFNCFDWWLNYKELK